MKFRLVASGAVLIVIAALYWFSERGAFINWSIPTDSDTRQPAASGSQPAPQESSNDESFKHLKVN